MGQLSRCTIGLLALAAQAAYKIKEGSIIDPTYKPDYEQTLIDFAQHDYAIAHSIAPKPAGSGETPLTAFCLEPQDGQSPLIISFRGTKTKGDILSDIRLGVLGVVAKDLRDAAFHYYQQIREANPHREIIITGHSLGGHLAHYVAARAYASDKPLQKIG